MFWNVYLDGKKIDSVTFDDNCDKQYVLSSLVNHDGYDPAITVRRAYALPYKRKTYDEWEIQVNYGQGFECDTTESTWKDAKAQAKTYRENVPYPVRIVKKRVKIGS